MIKKIAHALTRKPKLVALIAVLLLIPSALGYIGTRVNYDILSYLPEDLDSVQGERLLEEPFHMAATSMLIVEGMPAAYTNDLINEIKEVPGVSSAIWLSNAVGIQIPTDFIPAALRDMFFAGDSTMMIIQYEKSGAVDKCLELLDTDYIDLLYLHQPAGNFMGGYRLLEKAYREGKIKAIGISNFHDEKLEKLLAECEIKPHVIQMESHPYYTDKKTMDRLSEYGTRLMAWYPLGHGDRALLDEPVFTRLAEKYGKSSAQIILRWHVQRGTAVIPGSTNPDHIRDNADIFDFELTDEEMAEIEKLNKNVRYYEATPEKEESYASMVIDLDSQE